MIKCPECGKTVSFNKDEVKMASHKIWYHQTEKSIKALAYEVTDSSLDIHCHLKDNNLIAAYTAVTLLNQNSMIIEKYLREQIYGDSA